MIETPSGKALRDENFPFIARFLPAAERVCVRSYYAFARAADDIADNPLLSSQDKIARLKRFDLALCGQAEPDAAGLEKARDLGVRLLKHGVDLAHARDLLRAFRLDAVKARHEDWASLMAYCACSAMPVGRFLLQLHREEADAFPYADALCSALQIINHLQDCGQDYQLLNRVYLPQDWLAAAGTDETALEAAKVSPPLRVVITRCLEKVAVLLRDAGKLTTSLRNRRLRMVTAGVIAIAWRLTRALERDDPLAQRVVLGKGAMVAAVIEGAWKSGFSAKAGVMRL